MTATTAERGRGRSDRGSVEEWRGVAAEHSVEVSERANLLL